MPVKMGGIFGVIFRDGEWWGILGNKEESLRDAVKRILLAKASPT
jgi:hypothetical protein